VLRIRSMTPFARTLRRLRTEGGWSQRTLARRAKTSDATICRLERGEQEPTLPLTRQLARALGLPLRDLVDPRTPPPRIPIAEARARLAQLEAEKAAIARARFEDFTTRRYRPMSELIRASQRATLRGEQLKNTAWYAVRRRNPPRPSPAEHARLRAFDEREERIQRDRQQVVLALVAKGGLFRHPAVRQCYKDARRLRDRAFLEALGAAVATLPDPVTLDEHGELVGKAVRRPT
jgi:transcriptional regulator with XRE-family HTH domain